MFQHVLQQTGAKVLAAGSALRALAILRTVVPSVIVTNIEMPDIDGFSFIATVREIPAMRGVPMIAMTTAPAHRHRNDWTDAGFSRALVKPVDPFVLCAMIAGVMDDATATKPIQSNHAGSPTFPLIRQRRAGTITVGAIQALQASARALCERTRRVRENSRDICQRARNVRFTAARVRAERPTGGTARAS